METPKEKPEIISVGTDDWWSGLSTDNARLRTEGVYECVVVALYSPEKSYVGHFSDIEKSADQEPDGRTFHRMLRDAASDIDIKNTKVWIFGAGTITEAVALKPDPAIADDPEEIDDFSYYSEAVRMNFQHAAKAIRAAGFAEDNINEHMSGNNEIVAVELDMATGRLFVEVEAYRPDPGFTFTKEYFDFKLGKD